MYVTYDPDSAMSYIYLMNYKNLKVDETDQSVAYIKNQDLSKHIEKMELKEKTYAEYIKSGVLEDEFQNDLTTDGYMIGIELCMSPEKYVALIQNELFSIYELDWHGKRYNLLAIDYFDSTCDEDNIIVPLTKNNDCFVIGNLSNKHNPSICYIKGIISSNEKIYPLPYWCNTYLFRPDYSRT